MSTKDYLGLSDSHWEGLSEVDKSLYELIRPMPTSNYEVDVFLHFLPGWLLERTEECMQAGGKFEINPDFQRGHVWTQAQRVAFVEALLGNRAEARIQFNAPNYTGRGAKGDLPANDMQCIDGLQRLTALVDFVEGKFSVFGGLSANDLNGTSFSVKRYRAKILVHGFANRAELLQFYLDINAGGTVHADSELERVKALLDAATEAGPAAVPKPRRRPN